MQVVTEAYVRGVSTRRVEGLAETLGVTSLSKSHVSEMAKDLDEMDADFRDRPLDAGPNTYVWADALTMKVRGRIVNIACLLAVGVNSEGTVRSSGRCSQNSTIVNKTVDCRLVSARPWRGRLP